jgi:2-dehydro-3-deoxyphosphogluconate aldolase/(4S)-4-hydroxy-2-oxoglutarate aldolase
MPAGIADIFALGRVVPVVRLDRVDDAVPMARALLAGGIRTVEITLRTPAALGAIRAVAREVPEIAVGAGTLLNPDDLRAAVDAGAGFFVSPGLTPPLLEAAAARGLAYLPGAASAAEIMMALGHGFERLKFFPAAPLGAAMVESFAGPFPQVRFCTTGGIGRANAADFLALANVACVGASWVATPAELDAQDWAAIEANARFAAGL